MSLSPGATSTRKRSRIHWNMTDSFTGFLEYCAARSRASAIRSRVTGWLRSMSSGPAISSMPSRRPMDSKKLAIAIVLKPAPANRPMPTRSASSSSPRVKFMLCCSAMPWLIAMAPSIAWPPAPLAAPISTAASIAAVVPSDMRLCARIERAMWRWRTCAVSWPSTPARSDSVSVSSISPALTQMKPP